MDRPSFQKIWLKRYWTWHTTIISRLVLPRWMYFWQSCLCTPIKLHHSIVRLRMWWLTRFVTWKWQWGNWQIKSWGNFTRIIQKTSSREFWTNWATVASLEKKKFSISSRRHSRPISWQIQLSSWIKFPINFPMKIRGSKSRLLTVSSRLVQPMIWRNAKSFLVKN